MTNNPLIGAMHLLTGLRLLFRPGLRRYLVVPLLVNIVVFSLLAWFGLSQFETLLDRFVPAEGWLGYLRWLIWPLFALAFMLILFYTFTLIANLIAAPFNGLLAARVELLLTGQRPPEARESVMKAVVPALLSELRKLLYFLVRALPLLLLFVIPVVQVAAPILWLAFSAWYLCLEYMDYPMANHGLGFKDQHRRLKQRRLTALGFGTGVTLMMMIPILNFATMPAAVAGATAYWVRLDQSS